ncbi:hypothetical protein GUJ93_ZPchr0014g46629 [Zizania palustris]|uniref:RING-type domain-containing protein n=1 Tax=Zizania palustris TaxID=103762 RepID=A0A8J5TBG0_ZIZPA|nr:hypothetical protein GUJ93_ZPchr0014g46629 [Zizania palustris]
MAEQASAGTMERRNPPGMDDPYVGSIIRVARVFDMGPGRTAAWGFVLALGLMEVQERRIGGVGPVGQALRFFLGSEETTGKSLLRSMYDVALVFVIFTGPIIRNHCLPKIQMWVASAWWTLGGVTTLDRTLADNCVICQERMEAGNKVRTLCCSHVFHKPCDNGMDIDMWLRENNLSCPVCRENKLSCSECRKSTRLPLTTCLCRRRRRVSP